MTDLEQQLKRIVDLLEARLGDSGGYLPAEPMTPSEFEEEYPVEAAMQIAVKLMMAARATPANQVEARLDKPAQVGNSRFGVGVKWSTVIGAAQRHHDYMNTPEKERDRIAMGKEFFERFATPADHIVDANKKVGAHSVPVAINETMAEEMGANGPPHSEPERLLFEAYCRGHCWAVGEWNGKNYVDMADRIRFAYWRDRAALGCAPQPEAQSVRDAERYRYLTSRVVMTDASTPGITVITFVDDAIDEPNRFLDEIVDTGLKSAPPQKPVSDEVKP